jgi:hypothetical protein
VRAVSDSSGRTHAWASAIQAGWFLHTVTPVQALKATYWVAFQHALSAGVAFEYQLEIAVEAFMVALARLEARPSRPRNRMADYYVENGWMDCRFRCDSHHIYLQIR